MLKPNLISAKKCTFRIAPGEFTIVLHLEVFKIIDKYFLQNILPWLHTQDAWRAGA